MKKFYLLLFGAISLCSFAGFASENENMQDDLNPTFHGDDELNPVGRPLGSYSSSTSTDSSSSGSSTTTTVVDSSSGVEEEENTDNTGVDVSAGPTFRRIHLSEEERLDLSELLQGSVGKILEVIDVGDQSLVNFLKDMSSKDVLSATDVGKLYAKMNHIFLDVKDLVHDTDDEVSEERQEKRNQIIQIALKEFGGDAHAMWKGFQDSLGTVVEVFNVEIVPHVVPAELGHELTRSITALKDAMSSIGLVSSAVREAFQDFTDEERDSQRLENLANKRHSMKRKIILRRILETIFMVVAVGVIVAANLYLPWLFPALKLAATVLAIGSLLIRCMAVSGACFQLKSTEEGYEITTTKELTRKMKPHKADKGDENPDEHDDDNVSVSDLFSNLYDALGSLS